MCTKDLFMYWFRRSGHNVENCDFFINRCLQIQFLYQKKHTHHKGPIFHSWRQKPFEKKKKTQRHHVPKLQEVLTLAILLLKTNKPVKCFPNQTLVAPAWSGLQPTRNTSCTSPESCVDKRVARSTINLFNSGCSIPLVEHKLFKSSSHTIFSGQIWPQEFGLCIKLIQATKHSV